MDQIVNLPKTESASAIETALGLDHQGLKTKRRRGWLYAVFALLAVAASVVGYQWHAGSPAKIEYTTT
ncbi:MAG: efflux RND transporter periplasmic adaptor subunit, partial [Mesorhizobium sp.]